MKNLSAFARFPLSEALLILITLVVCLAGFTKAEVNPNYRKQGPSLRKNENFFLEEGSFLDNFPDTRQVSEPRGHDLRGKRFFNLKKFPESFLDRPNKRQSDYIGDSSESESEKESDGYGYDDDEYYHFNFKRNDDPEGKTEISKSEKPNIKDISQAQINNQAQISQSQINNQASQKNCKDDQKIEILSYQESHPIIQQNPNEPYPNNKPFSEGSNHIKTASASTLTGTDFKENSAIDESNKERNKQSETLTSSESKITEPKQSVKASNPKESSKLQHSNSKLTDDSDKKEKALLGVEKDPDAASSLKENSNPSEEKEKVVKLSSTTKLKDSVDKITSSKSKVSENTKLTKENKDVAKYSEKRNSDMFDANALSDISSGASFVGNDYKDNLDALKSFRSDEDLKSYGENPESEKILTFGEFAKDSKENQDKFLKENRLNALKNERNRNLELLAKQSSLIRTLQNTGKPSSFGKSATYDFQPAISFFKKSWRDPDMSAKFMPEFSMQTVQQIKQEQQLDPGWSQVKHTLTNLPPSELENTDYHKNFVKSLKKYRAQNESAKYPSTEANSYSETNNLCPKNEIKKKKRSKPKKRRSMGLEKNLEDLEKSETEKFRMGNQKRTVFSADDSFADTVHECIKTPESSDILSIMKASKEDTNLSKDNKYFDQWNRNRQRRKFPHKLEYEIEIINQKQPEEKEAKFSGRLKKNTQTKLANPGRFLKKYPFTQVSRYDLTKISSKRDLTNEKKFKRKASIWKRDNQKSIIHTRAVPSGYYSNRVKFGQKNYLKGTDKQFAADSPASDISPIQQTYFTPTPLEGGKNLLQRMDENDHLNLGSSINTIHPMSPLNPASSLLLLKKDGRTTKVFQDENPFKINKDNELHSGQFSNILSQLSQDKNYIVYKKNDGEKYRKNGDIDSYALNLNGLETSGYAEKQFPFLDLKASEVSSNAWSIPYKNLQARSSAAKQNVDKFGSDLNLNKAMDKFRDAADFFQDNNQEFTNNRYLMQEAQEKPDIVFSEDRPPDPIIINNEDTNKDTGLKTEPVNPIFAISNNFKNIEQQTKKADLPEGKSDNFDMEWKPALKDAFPEAKSVNSVVKNGNEIIVLDLNGNPLKFDHENIYRVPAKDQSKQASSLVFGNTNQYLVSNEQDFLSSKGSFPYEALVDDQNKNKARLFSNDRAVAIIKSADNQSDISGSLHELAELPEILKSIMIKVPVDVKSETHVANYQSSNITPQNEVTQNYNQLNQGFADLPGMKIKKDIILSSKSFPEQSPYSEKSLKNIENVLLSLLNPASFSDLNLNDKSVNNDNLKTREYYQNFAIYPAQRQNLWPASEKNGNFIPVRQQTWNNNLKPNEDMNSIIKIEGGSSTDSSKDNKLIKELALASEKIHRLRRQEMEAEKLRKTIEGGLAFKETENNGQSETNEEDKTKKYNADDKPSIAQETANEKNIKSKIKDTEEAKEDLESEKTLKSDYENHMSELFEQPSGNKNQKSSKDATWSKKKRMETSRRKRCSSRDLSSKVSKTEVQNEVVKSLIEDNYESVYPPGLKRKLLSTSTEIEDLDSNSYSNKHDDKLNAKELQENPVKIEADKTLDQMLVKLFSGDGNEAEKNRERRSALHSDFKREIDLDESMPNDFQNFLMTSLGGFGSQKREVVKKGEVLWEGKDITQDNYNQVVENGKETVGDSALEKREVPPGENLPSKSYKTPVYYAVTKKEPTSFLINHLDKTTRSAETNTVRIRQPKFADDKPPTKIRIKISNASNKEKKSSKPIMEENETTSTEMENLPKEKEFFDKNKVNPLLSRNFNKFQQHSGATFSDNEFADSLNKNLALKRKPFRPYWSEDRMKKKFNGEMPMSFNRFDRHSVESLVQNEPRNRDTDQLAQKASENTPLPQVETVYNPTQGANKAQIERSRLGKVNSVKNKSLLGSRNKLQHNEAPSLDDAFLKTYLKTEEIIKPNKGGVKEYGDVSGQVGEPASLSSPNMVSVSFNDLRPNNPKSSQVPQNRLSFGRDSSSKIINSQFMSDFKKPRQQLKNHNTYDSFVKPSSSNDNELTGNMFRNKGYLFHSMEAPPNALDYFVNRKILNDYPDSRNNENNAIKFSGLKQAYSADGSYPKSIYEKPAMDIPQMLSIDNSKENDYLDNFEDEYSEIESKEPQSDDAYSMFFKDLNRDRESPNYQNSYNLKYYKNQESGNNINGDEKEYEYEENGENEDLEDYSQLLYKNRIEPEKPRLAPESPRLQENVFRSLNNKYYNRYAQDLNIRNRDGCNMINSDSESNTNLDVPEENPFNELDAFSESDDLLKRANVKSNIFEKNLMKNLYEDKLYTERSLENPYKLFQNKLNKRKLNFPKSSATKGSRVLYASKVVSDNTKNLVPPKIYFPIQKRNNARCYYNQINKNPFNAEFASVENDFDHETEECGVRFNDNFMGLEKNNVSEIEKKSEELEEDVEENVEDGGEDNVLENIIGKYIMRKRIVSSNDLSADSEQKAIKSPDNDKTISDEHKIVKRSADLQKPDDVQKILKKRRSSGHLTENNFKKFHKKNLAKKRHVCDLLSIPYTFAGLTDDQENSMKKGKSKEQRKRSAFDIFKKITNKDKDKKVENAEGRTAGFEPLTALSEKSRGFIKEPLDRQSSKDNAQNQLTNNLPELKAHYPNEGQRLRSQLAEWKKGNTNVLEQTSLAKTSQGPWKVELNSKYERPSTEISDNFSNYNEIEKTPVNSQNGQYKAFLVISNNANAIEQSSKNHPFVSKLLQSESGTSYWPNYSSNVKKRSLKFTLDDEDAPKMPNDHVVTKPNSDNNDENDKDCNDNNKNNKNDNDTEEEEEEEEEEEVDDDNCNDNNNNNNNNDDDNNSNNNKNKNNDNDNDKEVKSKPFKKPKNISEEISKHQAFQEKQRSFKINKSSASDSEENENLKFFSKGKINNRKSVIPPSSASNNILVKSEKSEKSENHPRNINKRLTNPSQIIRDSRHINEKTREYHNRRMVDAILSQANENSQLKKLFAPGLATMTPAHKEGVYSKSKSSTEMYYSNEFRPLPQKFMVDLKNLGELQVEKKKCKKIDGDLKRLLQSLLSQVENNNLTETSARNEKSSLQTQKDIPEGKNLSRHHPHAHHSEKNNVLEDLKKKQHYLKIIVLTLPQDALDIENPYLVEPSNETCTVETSTPAENKANCSNKTSGKTESTTSKKGCNKKNNASGNSKPFRKGCKIFKTKNRKANQGQEIQIKPVEKNEQNDTCPVFCICQSNFPSTPKDDKTTQAPAFESTFRVNIGLNNSGVFNSEDIVLRPYGYMPDPSKMNKAVMPTIEYSNAVEKPMTSTQNNWNQKTFPANPTGVNNNKPGSGYVLELQLAPNNQRSTNNSYVVYSNPSVVYSERKSGIQALRKNSTSPLMFVDDLKRPQTLVQFYSDYSRDYKKKPTDQNIKQSDRTPHLVLNANKKTQRLKSKKLQPVSLKIAPGLNAISPVPGVVVILPKSSHTKNGFRSSNENNILKKRNVVPRFMNHYLKIFKE